MTEAELLREVLRRARAAGLLAHHCRDSRHCDGDPGFPDLVIAGRFGVLLIELKTDDGDTSADQDRWLWTLDRRSEVGSGIWRPKHLANGEIDAVLREIA